MSLLRTYAIRGAACLAALAAGTMLMSQTPASGFRLADVPADDPILRAMHDELQRSEQLKISGGGDPPYFISYSVTDADNLDISAALGAAFSIQRNKFRAPAIEVRVGNYDFDQTGHIFSGYYTGSRFDTSWPLDSDYTNMRQSLWLSTDASFKGALESMARKRASLNNAAAQAEVLPDFSRSAPVVSLPKITTVRIDEPALTARATQASNVFRNYAEVLTSGVELHFMQDTTYLVNSEGTAVRYPDNFAWIYGKAEGQAADGMLVHDSAAFLSQDLTKLPTQDEVTKGLTTVGENLRALAKAPRSEAYSGPTLFEPQAAGQLLAQLVGENLRPSRRPIADPGRTVNYQPSELESRMGSRILPDWMDITDDSTVKTWQGKGLAGAYDFDIEGVAPKPVSVVEKGVFKNFLTTRQPIKNFTGSNGHARLAGAYGTHTAAIGNLFVKTSENAPLAALKQRLIDMAKERSKPYGLLIRKLDYPFSGSGPELQALAAATAQSGGGRLLGPPLLVYRVYPDGREELVRGLRFRNVSTRTLRDILAASSETALFEFVGNGAPLSIVGGGGYLAPTSVVSPALLFDEVEFDIPGDQMPRSPVVPAPPRP